MKRLLTFAFLLAAPLALAADALPEKASTRSTNDWPQWRGPLGTGIAAPDQKLPLKWSASENVVWKTPVPGRGHGSPIVWGDRIFLTTADEAAQTQRVLAFDRKTG